jgi:hypothetical protein
MHTPCLPAGTCTRGTSSQGGGSLSRAAVTADDVLAKANDAGDYDPFLVVVVPHSPVGH